MTKILFALTLFLVRLAPGQIQGIRISSYDIDATIRPHGDAVDVAATCTMDKVDTASQMQLLLSSTCRLQSVLSLSAEGPTAIPFTFPGKDTLQIVFPPSMRPPGLLTLKFTYAFPIDPLGDSLLLLDRGSRWYPLVPDQIALLKLQCEVPSGYTVLSAGDLLEANTGETTSRFVWETRVPIFKVALVVFPSQSYSRTSITSAGKTIILYSAAAETLSTSSILAEAKNAFSYFTFLMGEYPHACLTLVEIPYFDGVDVSTGLLMIGSASLKGMGQGEFDPLHLTIAEQWMGAGVFAKFRQPGFWFFTISLPHYLRLMYLRDTKGEDAFDTALNAPLKKYREFAGMDSDVPILDVDFPNSREKGLVLYAKGPFVINELRDSLGNGRWSSFLSTLYTKHLGRIITYKEFRKHIADLDREGTLLPLWDARMTQKGLPAGE